MNVIKTKKQNKNELNKPKTKFCLVFCFVFGVSEVIPCFRQNRVSVSFIFTYVNVGLPKLLERQCFSFFWVISVC